jgi:hypothetical protein
MDLWKTFNSEVPGVIFWPLMFVMLGVLILIVMAITMSSRRWANRSAPRRSTEAIGLVTATSQFDKCLIRF